MVSTGGNCDSPILAGPALSLTFAPSRLLSDFESRSGSSRLVETEVDAVFAGEALHPVGEDAGAGGFDALFGQLQHVASGAVEKILAAGRHESLHHPAVPAHARRIVEAAGQVAGVQIALRLVQIARQGLRGCRQPLAVNVRSVNQHMLISVNLSLVRAGRLSLRLGFLSVRRWD